MNDVSIDKYQEFDTILSTNLRSIRTLRWTFFQHLTSLKKLENIELYQAQILEETLDCLSHLTSLTSLHINQTFFFHPRYLLLLSEFTSLKRFTLQNPIFFQLPLEFNWWSSLTKLQTLLVSLPSAPSYETTSLKPLSSLLHLEALIFTPGVTLSSPKSESLLPLAALTTLRTLILPLKCSFHELTPLSKLTNLRTLNISSLRMHPELLGYENFSVEVQTPTDMDEMTEVENSNPNIDNESEVKESSLNVQTLECLTTLQQLQEVGLPVGFPTEGFLSLAKLSSLTSLQIDHKPQQPHEWINELSQIVHLKSLSFVLTESLLNVLPHLTNLHTLKLKGTDLPPHQRHFLDLNCLSHLQNLFMTGFEIPIEIALSKHTSLNSLSFTRSQISPSVHFSFSHSLNLFSFSFFVSFFLSFFSLIQSLFEISHTGALFSGLSGDWSTHFTDSFGSESLWSWYWIWYFLYSEIPFSIDSSQNSESHRKLPNPFTSTWFSLSIHECSISSLLEHTHQWRSWYHCHHSYNTHSNLCAYDSFRVGIPQIEAVTALFFLWLPSFLRIWKITSEWSGHYRQQHFKQFFFKCFLLPFQSI